MSEEDSAAEPMSVWLANLKAGEVQGLEELWSRFYGKLVAHAKARIRRTGLVSVDEEDVACSVMESLWRAAQEGRLVTLQDCDELWWWLLKTSHRKVVNHARHYSAQKRGGTDSQPSLDQHAELIEVLGREPDPEYMAILLEEYERALNALQDNQLRKVAELKLAGATNDEICAQLGIAPATVTRKLKVIHTLWEALGRAG